jgi:hypothetical protein
MILEAKVICLSPITQRFSQNLIAQISLYVFTLCYKYLLYIFNDLVNVNLLVGNAYAKTLPNRLLFNHTITKPITWE